MISSVLAALTIGLAKLEERSLDLNGISFVPIVGSLSRQQSTPEELMNGAKDQILRMGPKDYGPELVVDVVKKLRDISKKLEKDRNNHPIEYVTAKTYELQAYRIIGQTWKFLGDQVPRVPQIHPNESFKAKSADDHFESWHQLALAGNRKLIEFVDSQVEIPAAAKQRAYGDFAVTCERLGNLKEADEKFKEVLKSFPKDSVDPTKLWYLTERLLISLKQNNARDFLSLNKDLKTLELKFPAGESSPGVRHNTGVGYINIGLYLLEKFDDISIPDDKKKEILLGCVAKAKAYISQEILKNEESGDGAMFKELTENLKRRFPGGDI